MRNATLLGLVIAVFVAAVIYGTPYVYRHYQAYRRRLKRADEQAELDRHRQEDEWWREHNTEGDPS